MTQIDVAVYLAKKAVLEETISEIKQECDSLQGHQYFYIAYCRLNHHMAELRRKLDELNEQFLMEK